MILRHEGRRKKPYLDSVGILTVGVGRNLTANGLSWAEVELLFQHDIDRAIENLQWHNFALTISPRRLIALTDLMFQLGPVRFRGFRKMIAALEIAAYDIAADELLDSLYADQVPHRAQELADILRTDTLASALRE